MASLDLRPPDLRDPAAPMLAMGLKMPQPLIARLDQQAAALHTTRAGLCRAFVLRGLEQLEAAATEGVG